MLKNTVSKPKEQWIWLDENQFPNNQTASYSRVNFLWMGENTDDAQDNFTVVKFNRDYKFDKPILSVDIRTSGDTFFRLSANGKHIVTGPASPGGDFLNNHIPRPKFYATRKTLDKSFTDFDKGILSFESVVRLRSERMFEYSKGHGGFFLTANIIFFDGTEYEICTDESWTAQLLNSCVDVFTFDNSIKTEQPIAAKITPNIWNCLTSPIPSVVETELPLKPISIGANESITVTLPLDMIYTGYIKASAITSGSLNVKISCIETKEEYYTHNLTFVCDDTFVSTHLSSAGKLKVTAVNNGDKEAKLFVSFITSCYPVEEEAVTVTDDEDLNLVLKVCNHTLKYCRQTLHLDSGSHCEPLACTGDYYIESLMTAMSFGDMRLAAFDVRRTADLLRYNDGRMFHTTYSLIWVLMLWDVYMITGEKRLLTDCEDALCLLLKRFCTYLGDNGLIENPPDYMFVDWLIPDGISLHHPPKALGQTCMNLFYYGALCTAGKIFAEINKTALSNENIEQSRKLKNQIIALLFDSKKQLFFEGLNTPTAEETLNKWLPSNVEKRYYRKHSNILAAYFGIFEKEKCRQILHKVMTDKTLGEVQPYFAHFLLEAVYRNDLREKYTLEILKDWKNPVKDCPYGLTEGFYKPEPTYSFDHSHAWGGTPAYSLPLALSGLKILKPGGQKISLSPSLLGLNEARVEIPSEFGKIVLHLKKGKEPQITVPKGIELV